jgi:dienelactone hydrolase
MGGLSVATQAVFSAEPDELRATVVAEAFGAPPTIAAPMLSPDGTQLVFMQQDPLGVTMLRSLSFADGSLRTLLQGSESGYNIVWCDFANEIRLICDLRQGIPGRSADYEKFYALNIDGTELQEMQRGTGCGTVDPLTGLPPFDRLPDEPDQIMFICGRQASQLNTVTRRVTDVSGSGEAGQRQQLFSNGHGVGNIYRTRVENADRWFVRDAIGAEWREFHKTNPLKFEEPFRPVGYGANLNRAFNIAWDADSKAWSLFRKDLTGSFDNRLVFAHGAIDVQLVDTMGPYNRVVSVAFLQGRAQRAIVDRRVAEVYEFIAGLLPGFDIEIVDESWDQNVYLAKALAPRGAGEFVLINMETEQIVALSPEYEHLTGYELAETRLIQFDGSDGRPITAHLTLPHDVAWPSPAAPVPVVIIPRSRPSHEDVADPNYLVQFLAASGYAVLRVNHQVEDEFGRGWLPERAVVGWNQTADDLSDAAKFVVSNGLAESDKICAAGKNYGAYSALISAIKYPDLFRCIVSIAGVTDPRLTPGAEAIMNNQSGLSEDILDAASPVKRAAELVPPVLMFHGENDADFSMANHTVTLANVLERANKDVRFIQYRYADHEIRQGPYRIDMLARLGEFLVEHIGPPPEQSVE